MTPELEAWALAPHGQTCDYYKNSTTSWCLRTATRGSFCARHHEWFFGWGALAEKQKLTIPDGVSW